MFIIPLPWNRSELEYLCDENDVFDLIMKGSTQPYYLIIQENTVTWLGQGSVPSKMAYQIISRSSTMNGTVERPRLHGNVGFMGTYSGIDDAVTSLFPKQGYCVSDMNFGSYTGQKLKGVKNHYSVIGALLCLMRDDPDEELQDFFRDLGWGNRPAFTCSGNWKYGMRLFIENREASNLEIWFANFCAVALR